MSENKFNLPSELHAASLKPFLDRTGAEQEQLRAYWFDHAASISAPIDEFLGMTMEQYYDWTDGSLYLRDGSYHEMEPHAFSVPSVVIDFVQSEVLSQEQTPDNVCQKLYNMIPEDLVARDKAHVFIFDPHDDVVAVISKTEVMHKQDFAAAMKNAGMDATERNFNEVWSAFRSGLSAGRESIKDAAMTAISSIQQARSKNAGLDALITSAKERSVQQADMSFGRENQASILR